MVRTFPVPGLLASLIRVHKETLALLLPGLQSGEALQNMIGSNPVRCEVRNKDQYGRNVSSCSVLTHQGAQDIGSYMVSNGYAVAYRYDMTVRPAVMLPCCFCSHVCTTPARNDRRYVSMTKHHQSHAMPSPPALFTLSSFLLILFLRRRKKRGHTFGRSGDYAWCAVQAIWQGLCGCRGCSTSSS